MCTLIWVVSPSTSTGQTRQMQRKKSEAEIGQLIRDLGGDWKKFEDRRYCPHCHQLIYRVDNQPFDGLGVINGKAFPIEVKAGDTAFPFSEIMPHQRAGLSDWQARHQSPAWLALQLGTTIRAAPLLQRRMWLVSWTFWLGVESQIEVNGFKSIALSHRTTNRRVIKELNLTAMDLLHNYELTWVQGGWRMSVNHPFRNYYLPIKEQEG